MKKADQTREKLTEAARAAFWEQGYSNTTLRDIAAAAGVDVALVSRYFGGKAGLFEATLKGAFHWPDLVAEGAGDPAATAAAKFADPAHAAHERMVVRMVTANATDPDVGALVRERMDRELLAPLRARMGGEAAAARVALFVTAILGASFARQALRLHGMADVPPDVYEAELAHLLHAALSYPS